MRNGLVLVLMMTATAAIAGAEPTKSETKRIAEASSVVRELRAAPDKGIPESIWDRARCVAVLPGVKKAALMLGGEFGTGVVSCRMGHGWSAPVFLKFEKGSFGAQIGAESTDLVLLIMGEQGMDRLLQDKVTLGADASLAGGPLGRTANAATDAQLTAEILSYSRARGLFAGIDLSGGVLRPDESATRDFYGHPVSARDVLVTGARERTPAAAAPFIAALSGAPAGGATHTGR